MDKALADRLGLKPLGKITGYAVAASIPTLWVWGHGRDAEALEESWKNPEGY